VVRYTIAIHAKRNLGVGLRREPCSLVSGLGTRFPGRQFSRNTPAGSVCVPRREISVSEGCRLGSVTHAECTRVVRQPTAFSYFRGGEVFYS
jgi:hypothetical protein